MSIVKNYVYNVSYQICSLIIPVITIPYISRILGIEGFGIYAFTNSIIQYFILFGTLGLTLYGSRAIAYVRDDKEKRSKDFWSIFILKIITTLASFIAFIIYVYLSKSKYLYIYLIQSVYLLGAAFDISWFFIAVEDFKKIVTRNITVKIIGVVFMFIFVRKSTDVWKYTLILSGSDFCGQLIMWMYIPKYVNILKVRLKDVYKHLLPTLKLFIPQTAIQIYIVMDKTMVGVLANEVEVGYYEMAQRIVKITLTLVTSMGIVMMPRVSNVFIQGNMDKVKEYLSKSFKFASYLSIPIMFGIIGVANEFVPWFFGYNFWNITSLISIISPIIVAIALSNVIGVQFMLPIGKEKEYTISVIFGAIVNLILNLLLIPKYYAVGSSFASVVAEFCVTMAQFYLIKDYINIKDMFKEIWKYFLCGIFMLCVVRIIGVSMGIGYITTIIQVVIGVIIYFILLVILGSDINNIIMLKFISLVKYYFKPKKEKVGQ